MSLAYSFKDYLMYQPQNDNVGNSIWITLGTATWGFSATGTNTGTNGNPVWAGSSPDF